MNLLRSVLILAALAAALAACQIEGGVQRPTLPAPVSAEPSAAPATALSPTAPPATIVPESGIRIGMLNDPGDLLPYFADSADERASAAVTELLFPAPLLSLSYGYTTTGVLERVPSLENGDVQIGEVDVYLDSAGLITSEVTEVITQVQQISVTFRWNPELRWSDGTPLTAADSVFAYDLARQTSLGQEATSKLALLERYEQVDEHTTRAVLRPDFTDPAYITSYWTPLPRHLLAEGDPAAALQGDFALMPVGYGPYQIARRDQGSLRLEQNPHFPGDRGFDTVSFIFRENLDLLRSSVAGGSLDLALIDQPPPELYEQIAADSAAGLVRVAAASSPIWEHLDFNLDVPALQDIRVRRAIAHAVNRPAMVASLLGGYGEVLHSWVVPGQWAAAPADQITRYDYNPDEARRLLDEVGIVDSDGDGLREAGGAPFSLGLVTTQGSELRLAAAEQIRADLAAVGVGLSVQELPTAALYSVDGPLFRRSFELALFAWIASPDPRGWERWSCAGVPNEANNWTGNNFLGWCFFEADQAIRVATTSLDQAERREAYVTQQRLFTQEIPLLPLFQRVDLALVAPTLEGPQTDPTAPITWNLATWRRP